MNINIKATGIELTTAISDYVHKKIGSLDKFLNQDQGGDIVAQVEVGKITKHHKSGEVFRAEVHIIGGGHDIYAATEETDLYAAIDKVRDEMAQELGHEKGKRMRLARRSQQMMKDAIKEFPWGLKRFKFRGFKKK